MIAIVGSIVGVVIFFLGIMVGYAFGVRAQPLPREDE